MIFVRRWYKSLMKPEKTIDIVTNSRKHIGNIDVDSGGIIVADPTCLYYHGIDVLKNEAFNARLNADNGGELDAKGFAVTSCQSGYGKGTYPAYATYNADGRIIKIEVIFD